jgi:DNA-binding response OmpR family regulator
MMSGFAAQKQACIRPFTKQLMVIKVRRRAQQERGLMRMLVVEDEALIAQDIAWVIEKEMQFTVVAIASTVEEALSVIASEKLDGAVLDAHLDGKSGESVAAALLERNIPFFVLSGTVAQELLPEPLNKAPMLQKPYLECDLMSRIQNLAQ